ncbi:MAG: hypothetical protein IT539_06010 [Bradyrhizobiaceae bacterium]|nr:hypothetical protein [Bradyrhizobiaceae bacterium]
MSRRLPAIVLPVALLAAMASAHAQDGQKLFFEGDMVRGVQKEGLTGPACVLASQFKRKESVVWRVRVLDAAGKPIDDKALKSLTVELPDGQKFSMRFGPHPRGRTDDFFWATAWVIPADYPTGTLVYKVTAVDLKGQSHTWEPFKIQLSQLTVIPGEVEFTKP